MKSIFKSVAIITVFAVITRVLGFVFRIYMSRVLGSELLGIYQISFSIFGVLLMLVSSGLPLVISKLTAKFSTQRDKISEHRMMSSALILALAFSFGLSAITLALSPVLNLILLDKQCVTILLILLPAVVFSAVYSVFRGNLWGHDKYFGVCATELFEQIVRIVLCIVFFTFLNKSLSGVVSASLSLTIACFCSAALVVILYFAQGGRLKKPSKTYKEITKSATPITAVRFAVSMMQPLIAIIIPLMLEKAGYSTSQALGLYGIAAGMTFPLLFVPTTLVGSLSMAIIPDLSTAQTNNDAGHVKNRTSSSIAFALFISTFLVPLYIAVGEQVGMFFYDNATSGKLLARFAWVMIPMGLNNISTAILNGLGLEMKSFVNSLLGSVLMILGALILPKFVGIDALGYSLGLSMTLTALLNIRKIKKATNAHLNIFKPLLKMCFISVPVAALTSFLAGILEHFFTPFFVLAFSCSIGAIFFFLLCIIFKVINIDAYMIKMKKFKLKNMKIFKNKKKIIKKNK